jgi:hypothetical protein
MIFSDVEYNERDVANDMGAGSDVVPNMPVLRGSWLGT